MPPGYSRVSDEDEEGPFRFGREAPAVAALDTSTRREMSLSSRPSRTSSIISRLLDKVISFYVKLNTRWWAASAVWLSILSISVGSALAAGLKFRPIVDVTLGSFQIPNQRVAREYDAMSVAIDWSKSHRFARSSHCCGNRQACPKWKFDIVYLPTGGGYDPDNIFTEERIEDIHSIEKRLTQHPSYDKFCWMKNDECVPINSLLTYFYPSVNDGQRVFDGRGSTLGNLTDKLQKAQTNVYMYWYVDSQFNLNNQKSRLLRSEVTFARRLENFPTCPTSAQFAQESAVADRYIISLIPMLANASTENVRVLYGGGAIYDYEVKQALIGDSKLAIISLCLIVVLVFILTSFSPYLTFMGILCVVESFPITYIIYRVFFGIPVVGILNVVSLFVIVGIGVDDVFVFINTFRLSSEHGSDIHMRLVYTIKTAGKTTLFTSVTTATAFFANLPSELPAIHDFGLFMGWLVVVCYLVTLLSMPAILYIWWKGKAFLKNRFKDVFNSDQNEQPEVIDHAAVSNGYAMPMQPMDEFGQLAVDNRDCINVESAQLPVHNGNYRIDDDFYYDDHLFSEQISHGVCCKEMTDDHLINTDDLKTCSLFSLLHHFIANKLSRWIIRSRIMLILLYVVLLLASSGLLSNLRTAEKPPQFFPSDSNIQQLIDIGYNLTNSDKTSCIQCSGFWKAHPVPISVSTQQSKTLTSSPVVTKAIVPTDSHHLTHKVNPIVTHTTQQPKRPTKPPSKKTEPPKQETRPPNHVTQSPQQLTAKSTSNVNVKTDHLHHVEVTPKHTSTKKAHAITKKVHAITKKAHAITKKATAAHATSLVNLCPTTSSCKPVDRPASGNNAIVYIVFGILDIDRSRVASAGHVVSDDLGDVVWDKQFTRQLSIDGERNDDLIDALCDICILAQDPSRELVKKNGADCFPAVAGLNLNNYCSKFKSAVNYPTQFHAPSHLNKELRAAFGVNVNGTYIQWMSMAFQSTTYKGRSSFENVDDYDRWNEFLNAVKEKYRHVAAIQNMYQTSSYWVDMFRETIAVSSAIYGILLSILLCMCWVILFTGHIWLVIVVFKSIVGTLLTVLSLMYLIGWTFGGVEAVTLSVLVGTSVDYIVHLVESFVISGRELKVRASNPNRDVQNRMRWAISHVGISIMSSAVTTVAASIPLCFAEIQLFAKFGQILLLNTGISVIYALTACVSMLCIFGGLRCCCLRNYENSCKRTLISYVVVCILLGTVVSVVYVVSKSGHSIPGPDGEPLF